MEQEIVKDYFEILVDAMDMCALNPKVRFIGQSVVWDGHALFKTLRNVPSDIRLELPVFEDFQMGMSTGLALQGFVPINIYPRFDFLIIAANQITNHLANIREVTGEYVRVITRVSVGAVSPLHPGPQHFRDHTDALRDICRDEIEVVTLRRKSQIIPQYRRALTREDRKPTILIEYGDLYHG